MAQEIDIKDGQQLVYVKILANEPIAWNDLQGLPRAMGAIRALHAMAPISTVRFGENHPPIFPGPPGPPGTNKLKIALADARLAEWVFYTADLLNYTVHVGVAPWNEGLTSQLLEIRRAIQSLHKEFPLVDFSWEIQP